MPALPGSASTAVSRGRLAPKADPSWGKSGKLRLKSREFQELKLRFTLCSQFPSFCFLLSYCTLFLLSCWHSKLEKRIAFKVALLQKRIPVGAKEESWVSAEEIIKSLLRDSESTKSTIFAYVLLCLLVLAFACFFVAYLLVFKT